MMNTTLDQLEIGKRAIVTQVNSRGMNRRRLMDLGILPDTQVFAELRSPLGDPVAYRIRGALIALRQDQASEVEIELLEEEQA